MMHHSAGTGSVETVHAFHQSKGWNGIAYNIYVRLDGSVWYGRGWEYMGGHDGDDHNRVSVGICAEGNFCNIEMPDVQKQALIWVLALALTKYPGCKVLKHSDVNSTACPGYNYPFDEIVRGAKETIAMGRFLDCVGHWAEEDIERCSEAGIINGRDEETFDPDANITRAEAAAIAARLLDKIENV